jgi:hypothetical protein
VLCYNPDFQREIKVSLECGILKCARLFPLLVLVTLVACGGSGNNSSSTPQTSGVKTRVLVSNSFISGSTGGLQIIDYSKNQGTAFQLGCCAAWTRMLLSSDRTRIYAVEAPPSTTGVGVFDKAAEKSIGFMPATGEISGFTASSDNKFIYAAIRNLSQIQFTDTTTATFTLQVITVPLVSNIVLTHNGAKLLAFSDQSDTVNVVDPVAKTATAIPTSATTSFDRPITAFFTTDDTTAYVINCGPECGGTQASVKVLDLTANPPVVLSTVNVPAATTALLDNGTLYLAGTTATGGVLSLLTVSGTSVTPSGGPISIGDGVHQVMAIGNGKLFVGARTCSTGCLSIVDLNSKTAVVDSQKGDVTGAAAIPKQTEFYVAEGGELRIYDTTTNQESQQFLIDIVGKAQDVLVLDQ